MEVYLLRLRISRDISIRPLCGAGITVFNLRIRVGMFTILIVLVEDVSTKTKDSWDEAAERETLDIYRDD